MNPIIKSRVENKVIEAHYDNSFWDNLAGTPGTHYPREEVTRTYYDIILAGVVVETYGLEKHATEWIEAFEKARQYPEIVTRYRDVNEELALLRTEYGKLTEDNPWLYNTGAINRAGLIKEKAE